MSERNQLKEQMDRMAHELFGQDGEIQDMESEIIELKEIICRAYIALSEAEMYANTPTIKASVLECHDISMRHLQESEAKAPSLCSHTATMSFAT